MGTPSARRRSMLTQMIGDGIPVRWSTVSIGWYGPAKYGPQLSTADIASYAARVIEANPEQPPCVLRLAAAQADDSEMVETCLRELAAHEGADQSIELRKWRLYLLREIERELSDDPLYGLLGLTEFWEMFHYPDDSPHVIQGKENHQHPGDYYIQENFRQLRNRHREWMKEEEAFLRHQK